MNTPTTPQPGWIAVLDGEPFDLTYWERALRPPFDPQFHQIPNDGGSVWGLRSSSFNGLHTSEEVMARAVALIEMLNGALRAQSHAEPLVFKAVGRIDEGGKLHQTQFAKAHLRIRSMLTATAEQIDASDNPVPPPPAAASLPQKWIEAAQDNNGIADMLAFAGRGDNWFDIYKAIEMARILAGDKQNLDKMLGDASEDVERMRRTTNFYRHARSASLPPVPTTLHEAMALLPFVIRTVLNSVVP